MEHRLRLFENRVVRKIFGLKSDEIIGGWEKLLHEDLHNLYYSTSKN
jgi:PAS domain-containing protein